MLENLEVYKHDSDPYALVPYSSASWPLALALSSELLSSGFHLIVVSLDNTVPKLNESLINGKPDVDVIFFSLYEDFERGARNLSSSLQSKDLTLSISCIDSSWWHNSEAREVEKQRSFDGPHSIFIDLQRMILPQLVKNSPAALLSVSDTCLSALDPGQEALARFLEKYTSSLLHEVEALGHEEIHIAHMDYYQKGILNDALTADRKSISVGDASALSQAVLRASTRKGLHTSPVPSHAALAWFVWLLLWILPQSILRKLF